MATLSATVKVNYSGSFANALDIETVSSSFNQTLSQVFANGTGAGQANQIWTDRRTLAASTGEDLDLAGSLIDAFGVTITFTSIKGIVVSAVSANTNDVVVGGAASNTFIEWVSDATDKVVVKPGGFFCLVNPAVDGYTVTAGTGDLLRVENSSSGTSVTYDIALIGEV